MAGAFAPADSTASSAIRVFPLRVGSIVRLRREGVKAMSGGKCSLRCVRRVPEKTACATPAQPLFGFFLWSMILDLFIMAYGFLFH